MVEALAEGRDLCIGDFEEDVFDDEVQRNKVIPLSDEEIALDASSEGTLFPGGPRTCKKMETIIINKQTVKKNMKNKNDKEGFTEVRNNKIFVFKPKEKVVEEAGKKKEHGESFLMTEEEIKNQKKVEQDIKVDLSKKVVDLGREELVDLLGSEVVEMYIKLKLSMTITASRDDGFDEIIQNFKASDLHLGEWMELMQFADQPSLGMILFNSHQRQDFIIIEDFSNLNNEMLYNVQEIFFRHHKVPGINDLAKTFGTFLVDEVDKRNLNPLKKIRVIEQLRQYSEPFSLSVDLNINYPKCSLAEDSSSLVLQPTVMIKAKTDVVKEKREALTPTQVEIFEKTCKRINFRRQEFCLVTGLHFGCNMYMKKWVENLTDNPFRNRMFPRIEAKVSVKLSDVIDIFDKMLWILEAISATYRYVHKQLTEKIPRALAWELRIPFSWSRCCTLFVGDQLAPPLEILTPTKVKSETDWWKASLEYFEGKHVQSEVVSEPLEIEKDSISEKKRKRGSSQSSLQDPTYDQLMTTVTKLEGTVATLTGTVLNLHGTIGTLEVTHVLILSLRSCLVYRGDERDFGVVSDGDIPTYMSPGLSYTSPASTAQKSLPLANRRKLRVRRSPLKLKSPMRCYSRKMRCTIPPPASTTMPSVTTISVPMTTTKDTLYPGGKKAEYLEEGKLDGLHINAFIELMMRKMPRNA
uniref:Uncharacterized protein n=1 Tax=Tanacetum cinerariifolium TaxID=118510 RepID=A0A6L2KFC2_TANCI|nr:hypothetical protein [Tanacetum cinerariifolium]